MKKIFALLTILAVGSFVQAGDPVDTTKKIRILGVGNSFTQNVTNYLPGIIKSDKDVNADIAMAYRGGSTMEFHVKEANKHEKNKETGKVYDYKHVGKKMEKGKKRPKFALKDILLDGKWDYITIQQGSPKSPFQKSFYPYARQLHDYIKKYAPDATVVMHETWPYRSDSLRLKKWKMTSQEMYEKLHANYTKVAKELGIGMIPAGTAFHIAKKDELWKFQLPEGFDMSKMKYPEDKDNLPDQSKALNRGFRWRKDKKDPNKKYLTVDAHHANGSGSYLAALVWYKYFFKKDPKALAYKPRFINAEQDKSLKMAASKAFEDIDK